MSDEFDENAFGRFSTLDILIIDDIGVEKVTDWAFQSVNGLVNNRYEYFRPTIITANLSLDELEKVYGSRLASRICESCRIKHFTG